MWFRAGGGLNKHRAPARITCSAARHRILRQHRVDLWRVGGPARPRPRSVIASARTSQTPRSLYTRGSTRTSPPLSGIDPSTHNQTFRVHLALLRPPGCPGAARRRQRDGEMNPFCKMGYPALPTSQRGCRSKSAETTGPLEASLEVGMIRERDERQVHSEQSTQGLGGSTAPSESLTRPAGLAPSPGGERGAGLASFGGLSGCGCRPPRRMPLSNQLRRRNQTNCPRTQHRFVAPPSALPRSGDRFAWTTTTARHEWNGGVRQQHANATK